MNWKDVLARDDIIGGELETREDHTVFRGSISNIKQEGDLIVFEFSWLAHLDLKETKPKWKKWNISSFCVNIGIVPQEDIEAGRIVFIVPGLGKGVIFPKGGSKLDLEAVEGFDFSPYL